MNAALVLIDIQNDYFSGGRNQLVNTGQALACAKQALSLFREKGLPVFHVQHINLREDAAFFIPGTEGVRIHEQVFPQADEKVISKHTPDSFFQTELERHLETEGAKHLVICGMMSHMCIDTTVRTAKRAGYKVLLLSDACATKDLVWNNAIIPANTVHATFMASLQGTFADVINTKELLNLL